MTKAFKKLNLRNESLMQENVKLRERLRRMESKGQTKQVVQTQTDIQSFPSLIKMDEIGVHFPLNVKKSTVSNEETANLVQTVAGKDLSNLFMVVTFPKCENEESSSSS